MQIDPMDPTGLTFSGDDRRHEYRTRKFTVSGFRNADHAQAWADAYYERAMGYGPIIGVIEKDGKFEINVNESTSCD